MNQAQRNFLIKRIEEAVKTKVKALDNSKPEKPSLNNYLLHAVMSNNFEIRSTAEIKELLRKKALNAKERDDWLGNYWGNANKTSVNFKADEIFVIPEEYKCLAKEYHKKTNDIDEEIRDIEMKAETLIIRIQLASDKTLQKMINEVDDMGNISLMDTKLKLLGNG